MQNEKKLVVLFPGFGYGPDKPLLYYAAKVARRQGLGCMVCLLYTSDAADE